MDWSRTGSFFQIAMWIFLSCIWWAGGYLIVTHIFKLRERERLFSGLATGLVLFIVLSNLFAYVFQMPWAFWLAAGSILGAGLVSLKGKPLKPKFNAGNFSRIVEQVIIFSFIMLLFVLINVGLSIFDDNNNIPLVSQLAAGDFPPHFYLDPAQRLDYHYGLHLFAAGLVQVGGLYPWSAFDFAKAISLSILLILAWLWFRRQVSPKVLVFCGVIFVLFASGTRWVLLLIPERILVEISSQIQLTGSALSSGPDLHQALTSSWNIEGGSPIPFSFAFANGILPPAILSMTGYGAMPYLTLLLLLLLLKKSNTAVQKSIAGLVLSSLAITGEHLFIMIWAGVFIASIGYTLANRPVRNSLSTAIHWLLFLVPGMLIALLGGGVLTEFIRRFLFSPAESQASEGVGFGGVGLRFPPAIISAHLGILSVNNISQFIVAIAEIGLIILLAAPVIYRCWKRIGNGDIWFVGLGVAAAIGLVFPALVQLSLRDRDISRMTGMALFILMVLGFPLAVLVWRQSSSWIRGWLFSGYLVTIIGGIALFPSLIVAVARPQASYFISPLDVQMARRHWNSLENEAAVLDPGNSSRPSAIFARSVGHAFQDIFTPYPAYEALLSVPNPLNAARAGYSYYYLDRESWEKFPVELQSDFEQMCMATLDHLISADGDFRTLYDIRQCHK